MSTPSPPDQAHGSPGQEQIRRHQREQWDRVASAMPDYFDAASTQYYRRCEIGLISRVFGNLCGKRVLKLDLWNEAVNTRILHWMEAEGADVFGLDISHVTTLRAARNANGRPGSKRLTQADIRHVPFASNTFDCVYTMGTIEHIAEYQAAVCEIARVLKPGARAIVGVPYKWDIFLRPLTVRLLELFDRYPYSPEKTFSYRELRGVAEQSGLRPMRRDGILAMPGIIRMVDLFCFKYQVPLRKLTAWMINPFDYLETRWTWPGRFGYLVAVVAEKTGLNGHQREWPIRAASRDQRGLSCLAPMGEGSRPNVQLTLENGDD